MQGMKVGEIVKAEQERKLKLQSAPPIICPGCLKPMQVVSYVLSRPDEARCPECTTTWSDFAAYDPACPDCGYSADHREGLGCRLEDG